MMVPYLDPDDKVAIQEAAAEGAVFVTWDRVVREAAGGLTPYEVMDKVLEKIPVGETEDIVALRRLRALAPAALAATEDAANKMAGLFRQHIDINPERAQEVRYLRVELHYSWRAIARWSSTMWGGLWGSNQIAGLVVCQKAAMAAMEDFMGPPWN